MPNSEGISSKAKKNNSDNFVWSEDEVELLLNIVLEHKTARTAENFDWQICQTKYSDTLDLFRAIPSIFVKKDTRGLAIVVAWLII